MAKRLSEVYQLEQLVQVQFGRDLWLRAKVVGFQHPGIWVRGVDGAPWFVTNGRRIRSMSPSGRAQDRS